MSPLPLTASGTEQLEAQVLDVIVESGDDVMDLALFPEQPLDRVVMKVHRPGLLLQLLVFPDPPEHHPQVPVAEAVAQEKEPALLELLPDRDRDLVIERVVEVVVLGDDIAVLGRVLAPLHSPVDLQDRGSLVERQGEAVRFYLRKFSAPCAHLVEFASTFG